MTVSSLVAASTILYANKLIASLLFASMSGIENAQPLGQLSLAQFDTYALLKNYSASIHGTLPTARRAEEESTTTQSMEDYLSQPIFTKPIAADNVTIDKKHRRYDPSICQLFDFAVTGFAKCGTSSMRAWLEAHEHTRMARVRNPCHIILLIFCLRH